MVHLAAEQPTDGGDQKQSSNERKCWACSLIWLMCLTQPGKNKTFFKCLALSLSVLHVAIWGSEEVTGTVRCRERYWTLRKPPTYGRKTTRCEIWNTHSNTAELMIDKCWNAVNTKHTYRGGSYQLAPKQACHQYHAFSLSAPVCYENFYSGQRSPTAAPPSGPPLTARSASCPLSVHPICPFLSHPENTSSLC